MDDAITLGRLTQPRPQATAERAATSPTRVGPASVHHSLGESRVPDETKSKLRTAANEFESVFMTQMLTHMFDGVEVDDTFGGGRGEEMFRPLLINEYGKGIVRGGGLGIGDQVYSELLRAQEAVGIPSFNAGNAGSTGQLPDAATLANSQARNSAAIAAAAYQAN